MAKTGTALLVCAGLVWGAAGVSAQILPADRTTLWNPGLNSVGGIPARTTIFKTLSPSGGEDSAAIQAALDACPAGQVVKLRLGHLPSIITSSSTARSLFAASGPESHDLQKPTARSPARTTTGGRPTPSSRVAPTAAQDR
jgi:hypothetical protein